MKKIFTLGFVCSMFIGAGALAQGSLELLNPQLTITGLPSDPLLEATFGVKNNNASALDVKVQRFVLSEVPGSKNNICWGVYCYGYTTDITPVEQNLASGATDNSFKGDYQPEGNAGVTRIRYCFFDMNNPSDSSCVTINFDASTTGIAQQNVNEPQFAIHPNPARSLVTLAYSTTGANSKLYVRDMLGKLVKQIPLDPGQQVLVFELSDLQPGVYFYNITSGNGSELQSKRLVITR